MAGDLTDKATAIFNCFNQYLNLVNYKPTDFKSNFFGSTDFFEPTQNSLYSKESQSYDDTLDSIVSDYDFDTNADMLLTDILLDEDSFGFDPSDELYDDNDEAYEHYFVEPIESPITSQEDRSEEDDLDSIHNDELVSNLSSDKDVGSKEKLFMGSGDSNFVNYTYWCVETGDNASTTSKPVYLADNNCTVSLLQESEAFVASVFWHSENSFKQTPRHLLFHVTQIANRAFFDPDYRKYLQLNYI